MTLSVAVQGTGPDLALLHGWGTDARVWQILVGELAQRFRVHAVDLPGYGGTPVCTPYTLERMAEVLAASLPARCLVCAWSLGGQAALVWALTVPQQVIRLALVATTPCFSMRPGWPHGIETGLLQSFARSLDGDCAATLRRFALLQARNDDRARLVARQLQAARPAPGAPAVDALGQGLRILVESDLRDRMGTVAQPVMVVHGERDTLVPLAAAEYLKHALPDARLAVIAGAAHAPFVSKPREAGTLLAGFFHEQRPAD